MFEDTDLFGISMAPRKNRRVMVVLTYTFTAVVVVGVIVLAQLIKSISGHSGLKSLVIALLWVPIFFLQIAIPGSGTFRGVFGRFVPEQTFSYWISAVQTLGLSESAQSDLPRIDEREKSVRNAAYFLAFKIIAWYSVFFLVLCVVPSVSVQGGQHPTLALVAAIPMVVMLFTLPQAIILWTEPDLTS